MNTLTAQEQHTNATKISAGLSDRYAPVNTDLLLKPFLDKGWYKTSHVTPRSGAGKELIILKNDHYFYSNGDSLTIDCINSNDGSSALMLMGGYGRVACSNGLVIGDMEGGRFIHSGTSIYDRIEESYDRIIMHLDRMKVDIDRLKTIELNKDQLNKAIIDIAKKLLESDTKKKNKTLMTISDRAMQRLTAIRREADKGTDAFTLLNVVQENIIRRGGLSGQVNVTNKETNLTRLEFINHSVKEGTANAVKTNKIISEAFLQFAA